RSFQRGRLRPRKTPDAKHFSVDGDETMEWYLPLILAAILGPAVVMYVVLDGFDLGIGILFPTARNESERDQITRSIAPFWGGNQTWLVLGGAGRCRVCARTRAV